jgi:serine/threonine protein phosphatase PrpC
VRLPRPKAVAAPTQQRSQRAQQVCAAPAAPRRGHRPAPPRPDAPAPLPLPPRAPGGFHKRVLLGTLEYMAPEVLLKKPSSFASDVYALAITLNEAATGTYPFSDCTKDNPDIHTILEHGYGRQELTAAVAAEGLRPRLPAGGAPPGYSELIEACWALDPASRPGAAEVARRLAEMAGSLHAWESERARRSLEQTRAAAAATPEFLMPRVPSGALGGGMSASASARTLAGMEAILDSESGRSSWSGEEEEAGARGGSPMDADSPTEPDTPSGLGSPPAEAPAMLSSQPLGGRPGIGGSGPGLVLNSALSRAAAASAPPEGMALLAGAFGAVGPRESMEDRQLVRASLGGDAAVHLVGVFDGHRGHEAAAFASAQLPRALQLASLRAAVRGGGGGGGDGVGPAPALGASPAAAALKEAFIDVDAAFRTEWTSQQAGSGGSVASVSSTFSAVSGSSALSAGLSYGPGAPGGPRRARFPGCTALAAVIAGGRLLVANAGDCRAVLCRGGAPLALSRQHTAELPDERARVLAAGGSVAVRAGSWRVGGAALQVTRALGDFDLKGPIDGGVTAEPEVVELMLTPEDQFIVMATDGVWDVMTDAEAIGLVRDTVKDPQMSAKRLVTEALARGSRDNATALVVFLRPVGSMESVWTRASGAPAPDATPTFYGSRRPVPLRDEAGAASADEVRETF